MARATRHRSGNGFGVTRILCRPSFANGGWHGGWHHRGGSWDSDPPLVSASDLAYSGRDSHSSLLQLPLLLQLPVSLWVFVPVWVCARARLWLWLRPLLDQMSGSPFLLSQDPHTPYSGRSCDNRFSGTISLTTVSKNEPYAGCEITLPRLHPAIGLRHQREISAALIAE